MNEKNEINYKFKFLYAIGIILVVAGHCKNGGISIAYDWFPPYAFHLGLFMFASGYFYKEKNEDNIKGYIWKKIKKLIIPMFVWNLIYGIFDYILKQKGFSIGGELSFDNLVINPIFNGHQFIFNMGSWFLVPLFCIEVFNVLFRKLLNKIYKKNISEYFYAVLYFILGFIGVYLRI